MNSSDPRLHHAANWLSRFTVNGVAPSDFHDVLSSLTNWGYFWCRAWSACAAVHEALGREALAESHFVSAGEHLSRAAVTYHFAKYLFVQDMNQMRAAHRKAVDCLNLALPHLDPPGERVLIPYSGKNLAATLRKPKDATRPPIVLMTMGLDFHQGRVFSPSKWISCAVAWPSSPSTGRGRARREYAFLSAPITKMWLRP